MDERIEVSEHVTARLVALDARRPWLLDATIVLGLIAVAVSSAGALASEGVAFSVALSLPLLWRRRQPVLVFGVVAAVALAQWLVDVRALGDVALLVALYSVATTESTRITLLAAAVLEVGIVMAAVRWAGSDMEPVKVWIGLSGLATAAGVLGMSVRSRRALVSSLHERAARLEHERDQQGRLSAAAERARIARDMHDIVAHHLSVMIALADGAAYQLAEAPDRAEAAMTTASQTGRQALTEMRRLLGVLRDESQPVLNPQPGVAQVDELVRRMRAAGVEVRYTLSGSPDGIEPGLQMTAYRIVQEALTNALKHAGDGARVSAVLSCTPDEVFVEVRDDGAAMASAAIQEGGGLRGMRERAAVYGGAVEAGPHPDGGWAVRTRLTLAVPRPAAAA
jgi:signal transduction histidine kinase